MAMKHTRYRQKFTELARKMPVRLDEFGRKAAQEMTTEAQLSFGSGPTGRVYGDHKASMPGYPPNVDTGALIASMNWISLGNFRYKIHDGVIYGAFLEFGTMRMAARPFLSPVFERWYRRDLYDFARQQKLFDI